MTDVDFERESAVSILELSRDPFVYRPYLYLREGEEDILDLPEVSCKVYRPGKQWGTNFNRDLLANILYHLRARKIYAVVYRDNYNGAKMAEYLEGDKEHSVKHALRDEPPVDVREAIDKLLKEKYS